MSSNTNLGPTPVNQGYVQLIHIGETGGIDGTLRTIYDGDGTASDLQIASNAVKISTTLYIGSQTILQYIQDAVKDILITNASHTNITATQDVTDKSIDYLEKLITMVESSTIGKVNGKCSTQLFMHVSNFIHAGSPETGKFRWHDVMKTWNMPSGQYLTIYG